MDEILIPSVPASEVSGAAGAPIPAEVTAGARRIVDGVRRGGDAALRRYAGEFDGLGDGEPIIHEREALAAASRSIPRAERELLERVAGRIRAFAEAQKGALRDLVVEVPGGQAGHEVMPLAAAGCYAPAGRHPLPSSVLMTAVTARAAGVGVVVVATPHPTPLMLAAADAAGADLVLAAGGAQAVAALAHGTETVPRCDAVVGPGNVWVTAAKLHVQHAVRTDGEAGPSELVVVVDAESDPEVVAADLLAQAEHDPLARVVLISLDEPFVARVRREAVVQLSALPTAENARASLTAGRAVVVSGLDEAVALCNRLAPEHLQWCADGGRRPAGLRCYGGLFLGAGAAEVLGDYGAGPNHVLPTGGAARLRGGLWVGDFVAVRTWLRLDDLSAAAPVVADAAQLAELEGLAGHAAAARLRRRAGS